MSARTPFVPFGGQPKSTNSSSINSDGSTFMPNPGNALHRGSGQAGPDAENAPLSLDVNKRLPLTGLLGQRPNRTASHGPASQKNLLQMAADAVSLNRPQTAAGNHSDSVGNRFKQPGMALNNRTNADNNNFNTGNNSFERIMSPMPIKIAQPRPGILTSPTLDSFKTPALPSQIDLTSPDHSMDFFNAHISNDSRSQRRSTGGTPVLQQPSPDSSRQSGSSSDEQMHTIELSGSFRTSTPSERSHGRDTSAIRARRVFPQQDYVGHDDQSGYYDHPSLSSNRRHPRDHHMNEDDQAQPPLKRQRSSLEPPPRGVTLFFDLLYFTVN